MEIAERTEKEESSGVHLEFRLPDNFLVGKYINIFNVGSIPAIRYQFWLRRVRLIYAFQANNFPGNFLTRGNVRKAAQER